MTIIDDDYDEPRGLSHAERERKRRLRREVPSVVREDLVCADCGAPLTLRLGRYGRFYGCNRFDETGCKGGVSAFEDGSPKGWPGNAETRTARRHLVERLEQFSLYEQEPADWADRNVQFAGRIRYTTICEILGRNPKDGFSVGQLNKEECEKALEAIDIFMNPEKTRWDHIRLGSLIPDDDLV